MPNKGSRELTNFVPSGRITEPVAPAFAGERRTQDFEKTETPHFFPGEASTAKDVLGVKTLLAPLTELVAHQTTETPLTIGILGSAGSGKSFALAELLRSIESLPQTSDFLLIPIEANELAANPSAGLAHAIYQAMGEKFAQAAYSAAQAARDPHEAAKDAAEKYETLSQKLNLERRNLEEAQAQRAKLSDTILYSSAASTIDTYAKSMKSKLEARFRRFGIKGDPILNFKDLVLKLTDNPNALNKINLIFKALLGFGSQIRLIVTAITLVLLGYCIQWASDNPDSWLALLRGNETTFPLAHWFQDHLEWIAAAGSILIYLGALALILNVWRAIRFLQPLFKGQTIFENELIERRRELNASLASQTQRVELLSRDAGILAQTLSEAERRIGGRAYPSGPFLAPSSGSEGRSFLKKLSALMSDKNLAGKTPQRIVFALDHLESLVTTDKNAILLALQNLGLPGFVILLALDPEELEPEQISRIEKLIQIPFRIGKSSTQDLTPLMQSLAGIDTIKAASGEAVPLKPLEDPFSGNETALLLQYVDLAGRTPRSLKRFFNLYRLCRMIETHRGALALWLALDAGGTDQEIELMEHALENRAEPDFAQKSPRLALALAAADRFGQKLTIEALQEAAAIARRFSFRL